MWQDNGLEPVQFGANAMHVDPLDVSRASPAFLYLSQFNHACRDLSSRGRAIRLIQRKKLFAVAEKLWISFTIILAATPEWTDRVDHNRDDWGQSRVVRRPASRRGWMVAVTPVATAAGWCLAAERPEARDWAGWPCVSPSKRLRAGRCMGSQPVIHNCLPLRKLFSMPRRPATDAGVAKLVDAPDLGSGIARCGGSSPFARTSALGTCHIEAPPEFS